MVLRKVLTRSVFFATLVLIPASYTSAGEAPPKSPASDARQRFSALITSVKPPAKPRQGMATVPASKGSLRAFGGGPPATIVRPGH